MVNGIIWRDAFENDDYSDFADDEDRELWVFVTVSPAENAELQVGALRSKSGISTLDTGHKPVEDALGYNYGNFYYDPLRNAGIVHPSGMLLKPYDEPITCAACFFVEGWEVKDRESVTLNINAIWLDGEEITGSFDIPLSSIQPVMVDVEGQPTHQAMIEEMLDMLQNQ